MTLRSLLLALTGLLLAGQAATAQSQVRASLAAADASIQPGQPVQVALRLDHDPHWHTYWIEAGTGYPTSITWTLPPGWSASDILWPTPKVVRDTRGDITGNGYEDITYLPVILTAPADLAPGTSVTFRAFAEWLMCEDMCIPGEANLTLTLPVRGEAPVVNPRHGADVRRAFAQLPRELPNLQVTAARDGNRILLRVASADGSAVHLPDDLWFFASDALVEYSRAQSERSRDATAVTLVLPVAESYFGQGDRLMGVLRTEGSWTTEGEPLPGLAIDAPLGTSLAALGTGTGDFAADAADGAASLIFTLGLALVGGLILNLMPCVFPVLGIKIMGFVNQAGSDRRKVALHGLVFSGGVIASFWALAAALAILRAGGEHLGWGFQLQSPVFVLLLTIVMLIFALAMSGVFEFGLSATGVGANLQMKQGYAGSFFTGVLATVVATPCSAPFLAPALGAALALPVATSFVVFTAIAIGLSLPYLLLSLFPGAIKVLPRPGAWMETFTQAMAFPLYATVGYLLWVLAGQVDEQKFLSVLLGLTLLAMGVWLYGRYAAPGATAKRMRIGVVGGLVLALGGAWFAWPSAPAPTEVVWQEWSPEAVAAGVAAGRPIYVDFTARWCATCQTNKRIVFASAEVNRLFRDQNILALRADWTNRDPRITAALAEWDRSAIPFNLVYLPGQAQPIPLPELLTPGIVLDAFAGL
jgi:thiol:disulfide interchange protein/DsbC/DsbD-like thiol-disulfide interchange protein